MPGSKARQVFVLLDWYVISTLRETGNITKTAELLYTSQPAVTKRLQAIEQELGCKIVSRGPKSVDFTPAGNRIVEKARIIIDTMQEIRRDIVGTSDGESGTLYLGVPYSYARFVLPTILEVYTKQHPNIHIDIHTALSDELVNGFRRESWMSALPGIPLKTIFSVRNESVRIKSMQCATIHLRWKICPIFPISTLIKTLPRKLPAENGGSSIFRFPSKYA